MRIMKFNNHSKVMFQMFMLPILPLLTLFSFQQSHFGRSTWLKVNGGNMPFKNDKNFIFKRTSTSIRNGSFRGHSHKRSGAGDLKCQCGGHCVTTKSTIERMFYYIFYFGRTWLETWFECHVSVLWQAYLASRSPVDVTN